MKYIHISPPFFSFALRNHVVLEINRLDFPGYLIIHFFRIGSATGKFESLKISYTEKEKEH